METTEASAFEQMILNLKLVSESELAEVHDEIGRSRDLQHLIAALERKRYLTPWQCGKVLKGDLEGYYLGGYRILYKIQSGSFGRVFRAEDPRDGRVVAIKVLRRRWSEDQQRIDLFIREGKLGLSLKHPNIVEVLAISFDSASAQYYIVMEFVEGWNLRESLQTRKKLTVAESLRIVEDCASALVYANSRQMTHRDIKLTNILLSDTGVAKLVDFGLAQFFSTLAKNEAEKVERTVDYAGLERLTEVEQGDVRSDIYFLGCVLYECLTGRPPWSGARDRHARMSRARFEDVKPIRRSEIDGPPSVLGLVETMMALDPKLRYQTPSQLLDAVRAQLREVEGKSGRRDGRVTPRSVFVAESDEHLQDVLRDGLKDQGFRVLLASDPLRALDRFRQHPFEGLIVDARTTGEEGFRVFAHIVEEANRRQLKCAAIVLLDEDDTAWTHRLPDVPHVGVLTQHITFKTVSRKLKELMEAAHGPMVLAPPVSEDSPERPDQRSFEDLIEEKDEAAPPRTVQKQPISPRPIRQLMREAMTAPVSSADSNLWEKDTVGVSRSKEKNQKRAAGWNILTRLTSQQITIAVILGVFVLGLMSVWLILDMRSNAAFNQVQNGMSEADVETLFGGAEDEKKEFTMPDPTGAEITIKKKTWKIGGKEFEVTFRNGKVAGKMELQH
jgi:serine/threonine protein kinase